MLEIILMLLGMVAIGYSFYYNSRTLSEIKDGKIPTAWWLSIKIAAAFILCVFFVFSLVFFDFVSLYSLGQDFPKIMMGFAFLASSLVITILVMANSASVRNIVQESECLKRRYEELSKGKKNLERELERVKSSKGGSGVEREITELESELQAAKKIANRAVGRELKMVELKKEIRRLKAQLKDKSG